MRGRVEVSAGSIGFVIGAAVPVAVAELGRARRNLAPGRSWLRPKRRSANDQEVDWDSAMPAPRTALRPRWEASSDPADEDDLGEFLITVAIVVVLTAGLMLGASAIARFAVFFLCGAALSVACLGLYAWIRRREMPPGARHVIVRGAVMAIVATIVLLWFSRVTYHGLTFAKIRRGVMGTSLVHRPSEVHRLFGNDGLLLYGSLTLALLLAIGLVVSVLVDTWAMFAATRLGEGSTSPFYRWLAQFYPRRQLRLWVSTTIIAAVAVILSTGIALVWYDHVKAKSEVNPAEVPIVSNPPGTIRPPVTTTTVPASTTTSATTSTIPVPQILPPISAVDGASTPVP